MKKIGKEIEIEKQKYIQKDKDKTVYECIGI